MNLIPLSLFGESQTSSFVFLGILLVGLYFFSIRPQQKREKETQSMRSKMEVGDEIITRGGIVGRVVSIKDDTLLIETGSDRVKLRIARSAVDANLTNTGAK